MSVLAADKQELVLLGEGMSGLKQLGYIRNEKRRKSAHFS